VPCVAALARPWPVAGARVVGVVLFSLHWRLRKKRGVVKSRRCDLGRKTKHPEIWCAPTLLWRRRCWHVWVNCETPSNFENHCVNWPRSCPIRWGGRCCCEMRGGGLERRGVFFGTISVVAGLWGGLIIPPAPRLLHGERRPRTLLDGISGSMHGRAMKNIFHDNGCGPNSVCFGTRYWGPWKCGD